MLDKEEADVFTGDGGDVFAAVLGRFVEAELVVSDGDPEGPGGYFDDAFDHAPVSLSVAGPADSAEEVDGDLAGVECVWHEGVVFLLGASAGVAVQGEVHVFLC